MELQLPPNQNTLGYTVITILFVISTLALLLRLNTQLLILRRPTLADFLLIGGYGGWTACVALSYGLGHNPGLFVHAQELPHDPRVTLPFLRTVFVLSVLLSFYIPLLKSAIMLEWIQIFCPNGARGFIFWACHFVMWSNIVFYITVFILEFLSCSPIQYSWDKTIPGGHCNILDSAWLGAVTSGVNLLTDIAILIIPQHIIWRLNMSRANKIGVSAVFAVGLLGIVAAVVRTVYIVKSAALYTTDYTYAFSSVVLAVLAEGTCVIFVVCAPAAPRTFAALPNVAVSLGSWVNSSVDWLRRSTHTGTTSTSQGHSQMRRFVSRKDDSYSEVDGHHLSELQTHSTRVTLPPNGRKYYNDETGSLHGILRETRLETSSAQDYDYTSAQEQHARQHPWLRS